MKTTYRHAGIGGTFDHLHDGHKFLITTAFQKAEYVSIGITTNDLIKDKEFSNKIQTYNERESIVKNFLKEHNWLMRSNIFPLNDNYGSATTDPTMDMIIVTTETKSTAIEINAIRKKNDLSPCNIITIPFAKGANSRIIRSSRIRRGIINRQGELYSKHFQKGKLTLPTNMRDELRIPLGYVVAGTEDTIQKTAKQAILYLKKLKPIMTIVVGDVAVKSLIQARYTPTISVIDFKTRRHEKVKIHSHTTLELDKLIWNRPGTIQMQAATRLSQLINEIHDSSGKSSKYLTIRGEEDLLALPAILQSPLGSAVIYGQYELGLIIVFITEEIKEKVAAIIKKFR
ncbi:hypothetical protein BH09PAT2_BH09PAT2_02330 [soil metagenome]